MESRIIISGSGLFGIQFGCSNCDRDVELYAKQCKHCNSTFTNLKSKVLYSLKHSYGCIGD